ncbi:hypothetical protein C2W62_24370 [Candidatus Entotheonella serta]|nr:hypothetical protein C2W62_24370 [Candidatus Entotheonella serta]
MSDDGGTIYFSAQSTEGASVDTLPTAVFTVPSRGGDAVILARGAPLEDVVGLLLSCDGNTLYLADRPVELTADSQLLYTLNVESQAFTPLPHTGIGEAVGLAFNADCSVLYVTGFTPEGTPALFILSPDGGDATIVTSGGPLTSPDGVFVDIDNIAWVMITNQRAPSVAPCGR